MMVQALHEPVITFGAFAAGVLIGGISPGYLMVRMSRGLDVREQGSGRTGATNAARLLGRRAFFIVLCADIAKGLLPAIAADYVLPGAAGAVSVGVVAGHIWPPALGLRGGRGAAPLLGAMAALDPMLLPAAGLLFVVASRLPIHRRAAAALSFAACALFAALLLPDHGIAVATACVMVAAAHMNLTWPRRETA